MRKAWEALDGAFVKVLFRFADGLALRAGDDEGFCRIARWRHLHETVVVTVGAGEFDIEIIAVWKSANGLRRDENILWKSSHGVRIGT